MTINLADNDPRVSYAVAAGATQSSFTVSFEFFDDADLNVYVDGTLKTLTTDYTVTGGDGSTGSITMSVTGAAGGSTVVITRSIALERTTDFPISGAFNISALNEELDRFVAINADLNDQLDRTLKLEDYDTASGLALPTLANRKGKTLAFDTTTGNMIAGPSITATDNVSNAIADIETVADDLNAGNFVAGTEYDFGSITDTAQGSTGAPDGFIVNVANNMGDVTTVSGISSNVSTVAGISANVTTVAGVSANVTTVAGISSDVTSVAGISSDVSTVAGITSNISTVASDSTDIQTVAGKSDEIGRLGTADAVADMNTLGTAAIVTDMDALADIASDISSVGGITADVTTVAGISSDITAVAGDATDIGAVAAKATEIGLLGTADAVADMNTLATAAIVADMDALADISSDISGVGAITADVTTVAGISANTTTVAGISANVTTVAGVSANVTTVAGISSDVTTVAGISSDVTTVATDSADIQTVADNIASVNDFADKYRIGATDPTTDNDEGDLFYNTTSDTLKVYNGSAWEAGVTAGSGFLALTGGTMTGALTLSGAPTSNLHAATKAYVDTTVAATNEVVEDTTPQLGGNLDVNGNSIVSASNGDIAITPNGTGSVVIDGLSHPQADGSAGQFLKTDGAGQLAFATVDTDLSNDSSPQLAADLDGQGNNIYSLQGNIGSDSGDYLVWTTDTQMDVYINGSNEFRFESDGDLHADGDVIANSTTISDERLKSNIVKIDGALDKVMALSGYTFNYNGEDRLSAGIIAQEVEKVLPSAVIEKRLAFKGDGNTDYKVVQYDQLHALLIEAIKEQQAQINALSKKIGDN